jgi:hypothetical protein
MIAGEVSQLGEASSVTGYCNSIGSAIMRYLNSEVFIHDNGLSARKKSVDNIVGHQAKRSVKK